MFYIASCRYVATPGLAPWPPQLAISCVAGNRTAWERDHDLVYPSVYVRITFVSEISKEAAHGGPGTCNPRTSGTCSAKREGATRAHPEK